MSGATIIIRNRSELIPLHRAERDRVDTVDILVDHPRISVCGGAGNLKPITTGLDRLFVPSVDVLRLLVRRCERLFALSVGNSFNAVTVLVGYSFDAIALLFGDSFNTVTVLVGYSLDAIAVGVGIRRRFGVRCFSTARETNQT